MPSVAERAGLMETTTCLRRRTSPYYDARMLGPWLLVDGLEEEGMIVERKERASVLETREACRATSRLGFD